jgi:GDP-4-dehydro-6-deoxy-D-mannose reductase
MHRFSLLSGAGNVARALITGISGFAGVHLAEHLLACGDVVAGTSSSGRWRPGTPPAVALSVQLWPWDLEGPPQQDAALAQRLAAFEPEHVYHLAALSIPRECGDVEPTPRAWNVNVVGTGRLLDVLAQAAPQARMLFVSSSHVYAPVARETPVVDEQWPLAPRRGYGKTKLAAERLLAERARSGRPAVVVARAFQHTGPRQGLPMMLPEWVAQFCRSDSAPIVVQNDNTCIDLSDVRDVVRAYRLLMLHGSPGEAYNVGSGILRTTGEVLEVLRRLAGPHREIQVRSHEERADPIADISRLAACTGWRPVFTLEQTVADTLDAWRRAELP